MFLQKGGVVYYFTQLIYARLNFWARRITLTVTTRSQKRQLTRVFMGSALYFSLIAKIKILSVCQKLKMDWVMRAF